MPAAKRWSSTPAPTANTWRCSTSRSGTARWRTIASKCCRYSPACFRPGTTLLPGDTITLEHLMDQTAITYATATVNHLTGEQIKILMEDIADNLYHADPYYQQGGDMVRVGGLQ